MIDLRFSILKLTTYAIFALVDSFGYLLRVPFQALLAMLAALVVDGIAIHVCKHILHTSAQRS